MDSRAPDRARLDAGPLAQARYSKAYGLVATERLHWQEAVKAVAECHRRRPSTLTEEERAGHRISHPLQRIQRDVNVLLNHPTLSLDPILEQAGRGLLGLGFTASSF
jgi:GTP cyclohydrolase II